MSETYKIEAVDTDVRNWSSQYGEFSTYTVKLNGVNEAVQLNKKSSSPAPEVGDEVYGDITDSQFGKKFKSAKKPFTDSSKQSSSPAKKPDAFLRDATTVPIDMIKALLPYFDVQSLKPNTPQYRQLMELATNLTEDALSMVEKIREGEKPQVPDPVIDEVPDKITLDDLEES